MPNTLFYQPGQKLETCSLQHFQPQQLSSNGNSYSIRMSQDQYCTLESSSWIVDCQAFDSPSDESTLSQQDSHSGFHTSEPLLIEDEEASELQHKLKELESMMLGPDLDSLETCDNTILSNVAALAEIESWRQMVQAIPCGDLKQVLIACAMAVSNNDLVMAKLLMSELRQRVSVSGEPIQRLGAYMLEGLVARVSFSGNSICKSLKLFEPSSFELLSYMHLLYEVCPYIKFGYMSANGAIAEAMKSETSIHIIDFQIGQGSQWIPLILAFAARPRGPPHIRITGFDDSTSACARGGGLNIVGCRLSKIAETFKVPFEFHAAAMSACKVQPENLGVRSDEALAVNFAFMLHRLPDEGVSTENHRDRLLRMVKSLNPKVVTLVEQEFNTNTAAFYPRFQEALDYYAAMFESIDSTLPRGHKERINVEQHCLARNVVNVIACEGSDRVERHEPLGKWRSRFQMAGFSQLPLSSLVNETIKKLLKSYCNKYRLEERDGALYLGWLNRDLVAACAWK